MANSKVELFGETLIDISNDTVNANTLLAGVTAHDSAGEPVEGNLIIHEVLNTLESDSTEDALSANKGRELKELVDKKYEVPDGGITKDTLADDVKESLGKADTALQDFTETDPTVPAWAKETEKPAYTAEEVSAKDKDGNDSTVQAELNVLRSSNSETVDARVGADGTAYPTLKDRLDAERKTSIIVDADGWLCTEGD